MQHLFLRHYEPGPRFLGARVVNVVSICLDTYDLPERKLCVHCRSSTIKRVFAYFAENYRLEPFTVFSPALIV